MGEIRWRGERNKGEDIVDREKRKRKYRGKGIRGYE
jgi:hypothetical protein